MHYDSVRPPAPSARWALRAGSSNCSNGTG